MTAFTPLVAALMLLSARAMATPPEEATAAAAGRGAAPAGAPARAATKAPARPVTTAKARTGEPPVLVALAAGAATAMIPLILGGTRAATGDNYAAKNAGLSVAGVGLALAPIISHVAVGEWTRAAAFGALPTACAIGAAALLAARPDAAFDGTTPSRITFGALFSVTIFSSAVGVVDAALAGSRARGPRVVVAPSIGRNQLGIGIMSSL
jgi:hypothetical protein